jgi:hypothetical protein
VGQQSYIHQLSYFSRIGISRKQTCSSDQQEQLNYQYCQEKVKKSSPHPTKHITIVLLIYVRRISWPSKTKKKWNHQTRVLGINQNKFPWKINSTESSDFVKSPQWFILILPVGSACHKRSAKGLHSVSVQRRDKVFRTLIQFFYTDCQFAAMDGEKVWLLRAARIVYFGMGVPRGQPTPGSWPRKSFEFEPVTLLEQDVIPSRQPAIDIRTCKIACPLSRRILSISRNSMWVRTGRCGEQHQEAGR